MMRPRLHAYAGISSLLSAALFVWLVEVAPAQSGEVDLIAAGTVVHVRAFTETRPATMDHLLAADRANGWDVLRYESASDTWRLEAGLHIGCATDLGTFMQIGRPGHERETVIVGGDVWIRPPRESAERVDGTPSIRNRLTLGAPDDASLQPTLKIACEQPRQYGLYIGFRGGGSVIYGGDMHVYHGAITAVTPDPEHRLRGYTHRHPTGWFAHDVRLVNAYVAWIDNRVTYGAGRRNLTVKYTTFEHCGGLFYNSWRCMQGAVFRSNACVAVGYYNKSTMTNCLFEGNGENFRLVGGGQKSRGFDTVDCLINPQEKPYQISGNTLSAADMRRYGVLYPACTLWRSLTVHVQDSAGNPMTDAYVDVRCPSENGVVRRGLSMTNAQGHTPLQPEHGAILVVERRIRATDTPDTPDIRGYAYRIRVVKDGYPEAITVFSPQDGGLPPGKGYEVTIGLAAAAATPTR